jgi:hypothetical protein
MGCEPVDYERFQVKGYDLLASREHVRLQADLRTDPIAYIITPNSYHPEVETRVWQEEVPAPDRYKAGIPVYHCTGKFT